MSHVRHFLGPKRLKLPSSPRRSHSSTRHYSTALPPSLPSRISWSYLWYASILSLGLATGLGARYLAGPLGLPTPGSREDELILQSLHRDIDNLEIVTSLRDESHRRHTDAPLSSRWSRARDKAGSPSTACREWSEMDFTFGGDEGGRKGVLGVLSGTRGLGVQRAFWNAERKELVAVVWIGGGLNGWPGVGHGGAIATVFEEIIARTVAGPEGEIERKHRPNSLSLTYAKPTYTLDFYVFRASFVKAPLQPLAPPPEPQSELTKSWLSPSKDTSKGAQCVIPGTEVLATLESVKGDLCAKAKGTYKAVME